MHTESYNIDRGRQSSVRTAQVHKPQLWHKVEYMIIFFYILVVIAQMLFLRGKWMTNVKS